MSDNSSPLLPLSASDVSAITGELTADIIIAFQTDNP